MGRATTRRAPARRPSTPDRRIRRLPEAETGEAAGTSNRSDDLVKRLADQIINGTRPAGSHLNEQALADEFRVSRTPVREALRQLSSASLVEMRARRGAFVAKVSVAQLIQKFELMSEIEGICARLAARRMTPEEKKALRKAHERYKRLVGNPDSSLYFEASLVFHQMIYAGSKNSALEELANTLYARLTPYRRRQIGLNRRSEQSFTEHEAVLRAIEKGDGDGAERGMKAHTAIVGDNVMALISALADG